MTPRGFAVRAALLALAANESACSGQGSSLVGAAFVGEALFSAELKVEAFMDFDLDSVDNPRWALFVMPQGLDGDICDVVEHPDSGRAFVLGETELNVFTPPDEDLWVTSESGVRYGLLRLMAYEDADGDGTKGPQERFIGDSNGGLMYVHEDVKASEAPTGVALRAGFHNVLWDGPCTVIPRGEDECGVPLGASCVDDGDCGKGGTCFLSEPRPGWPGGYCALAAEAGGCEPQDGRLFSYRAPGSDVSESWWVQACESDDACRVSEGYACQPTFGQCRRQSNMRIEAGKGSKPTACKPFEAPEPNDPADAGVKVDDASADAGAGDEAGTDDGPMKDPPSELDKLCGAR